jgi:hypothetical protein
MSIVTHIIIHLKYIHPGQKQRHPQNMQITQYTETGGLSFSFFLEDFDGDVGGCEEGGGGDEEGEVVEVTVEELFFVGQDQEVDEEEIEEGVVLFEEDLPGIEGEGGLPVVTEAGKESVHFPAVGFVWRAVGGLEIVLFGVDDKVILEEEAGVEEEEGEGVGKDRQQAGVDEEVADIEGVSHQGVNTRGIEGIGPQIALPARRTGRGITHGDDTDGLTQQGQHQTADIQNGVIFPGIDGSKEGCDQNDQGQGRKTAVLKQKTADSQPPTI